MEVNEKERTTGMTHRGVAPAERAAKRKSIVALRQDSRRMKDTRRGGHGGGETGSVRRYGVAPLPEKRDKRYIVNSVPRSLQARRSSPCQVHPENRRAGQRQPYIPVAPSPQGSSQTSL
jgi:hypothetical protein